MRTVWKFPLHMPGWNDVEMGEQEDHTTKVVLADIDPITGKAAVWVEGDNEGRPMTRSFAVYPTGGRVPGDAEHIGSMISRGGLVWHVYERPLYHGESD